jgi:hypothetical protein
MATLIRHAGLGPPQSVGTLAVSVALAARFCLLVATVGCATLLLPGCKLAHSAAVTLTTVAMTAYAKDDPACATVPDSENNLGHIDLSSPITLKQRRG